MVVALLALAAAMIVGGRVAVVQGYDIVLLERGWTLVISGSVCATGGALLLGLSTVLSRLGRIQAELVKTRERMSEAGPVLPPSPALDPLAAVSSGLLDGRAGEARPQPPPTSERGRAVAPALHAPESRDRGRDRGRERACGRRGPSAMRTRRRSRTFPKLPPGTTTGARGSICPAICSAAEFHAGGTQSARRGLSPSRSGRRPRRAGFRSRAHRAGERRIRVRGREVASSSRPRPKTSRRPANARPRAFRRSRPFDPRASGTQNLRRATPRTRPRSPMAPAPWSVPTIQATTGT